MREEKSDEPHLMISLIIVMSLFHPYSPKNPPEFHALPLLPHNSFSLSLLSFPFSFSLHSANGPVNLTSSSLCPVLNQHQHHNTISHSFSLSLSLSLSLHIVINPHLCLSHTQILQNFNSFSTMALLY